MPPAAQAGCPPGQEPFTSCQIAGRNTEVFVCFDDQLATYRYGPIGGAPDLILSETIEHLDFEPWSGSCEAIVERATFYNGDYSYEGVGGFDRPFSEEEMQREGFHFGWLEVARKDERLGRLDCIPETVSFGVGTGLQDVKAATGLRWDAPSQTWVSDRNQPTAAPVLQQNTELGAPEVCLPATEFGLNGVMMGDAVEQLGKLGSPEPTEVITEDGLPIDRITLVGAVIDIDRNEVVAMSTTSSDWRMPSGLRVGLTRGEVIGILGRLPHGYTATSDLFLSSACLGDQDAEWIILIAFGQDKRVQSISFSIPSY